MNTKKFIIFIGGMVISIPALYAAELTGSEVQAAFDAIWLLLCASMVFFMQAGFAMVEAGLTRAKNAGNIMMKNLMDFSVGALMYWALGWGFMYGDSIAGLMGGNAFFASGDSSLMRDLFFQIVFAATAATIVSGAMAERTKFTSYLIYSIVITGFIYPIAGHWVWHGDGWLASRGFYDFAGSTVVHSLGGWMALAGAIILGPRIGKYIRNKENGKVTVNAILGHNLPLAALGVFILWFGWYGFNAGSTLSGTDVSMAIVVVNTTLSASAGAIAGMLGIWLLSGKPDVSMSLNGALAGLVGITAPCAVVSPVASIIIGVLSGLLVVVSVEFIDKVLHIDDPVGAISVHGVCGVWGTLAVGIFGNLELIGSGLSRGAQIWVQVQGSCMFLLWALGMGIILFGLVKHTLGLRVSEKEEMLGLDIGEHGTEAYASFQFFQNM